MTKRIFAPVINSMKQHDPSVHIEMPERKTGKSAGYDFHLPVDISIPANTRVFFWTDIKAYMPDDEVLSLHIRSSIGTKKGVILSNLTGIVDADYADNPNNDGNIGFSLWNTSDRLFELKAGEAFAQGIFTNYKTTDDDTQTAERKGGYGSTGSGQ